MKKEKKFMIPEAEIIGFENNDIITKSGEGDFTDPIDDDDIH